MSAARFRVNAPRVIGELVDGEVILINLETGHYYSLVDAGAVVWTALVSGGTPDDAVAAVSARYVGDRGAIAGAVGELVDALTREALLVPAAEGEAPGAGGHDPTSAAEPPGTISGARIPFVAPRLEKYIDMQKLIALDPVLETDESGWPKPERT